jgi:predicted acyl esterase
MQTTRPRALLAVLALAAGLAASGCVGQVPPATPRFSSATRAWWAYDRPATFDVARTQVDVPMRDGTPIACTLSRPARAGQAAPGRFPGLIVEFTPYASAATAWLYDGEASFFVTRGYNALVCTVRGTGRSGGTWQHAMSSQDGRDAHDLIEWLAVQPFSNGRIGQFGESYGGYTSYAAAVERPPHLRAVAPEQPPGDLYNDVIYPGGIKATEGGTIDNWPPIGATLSGGRFDAETEYATNRAHPTYDAYWRDHSIAGRESSIEVPVLTIGGWDDGYFRSGTLAAIEAAPDRTWAIYGQWPHAFPVSLGPCLACVPEPLPSGVLLAWFDHWVAERPGVPIPARPTFVSYEGPRGTGGTGWHELRWNPAHTRPSTVLDLGPDGTLARHGRTGEGTAPVTFHQPAEPTAAGGSATFTTASLRRDRVLAGHPHLSLRATLTAADANFYVELIDVDPRGRETVVNDGFLKASHRASHTTPRPVTPGRPTDYRIPIRADHYRFAAGHQIRLRISGGPSQTLVPVTAPVDVTIETGPASTLHVPLTTRP